MEKTPIRFPFESAYTGAYSPGILCDGWLYVSGQASLDPASGELIPGTIEEETLRTLANILLIVQAAGGGIDDIIKCTVHLIDITEFDRFDAAYRGFFSGIFPARTTVQSVLGDGIKIEIDAIARI